MLNLAECYLVLSLFDLYSHFSCNFAFPQSFLGQCASVVGWQMLIKPSAGSLMSWKFLKYFLQLFFLWIIEIKHRGI